MDEEMFPDYEPKISPDTIYDYGIAPDSRIQEILNDLEVKRDGLLPSMELKHLDLSINIFNDYVKKAEKNPGDYREGNIILGAPEKDYIPSEAALIVSEIGKLIQHLMLSTSLNEIEIYKKENDIQDQQLIYHEINFDHMDVMGSGRFFYAYRTDERISLNL